MISGGMRSRGPTGVPPALNKEPGAQVEGVAFPRRGFGRQRSSARPLSLGGNSLVVAILSPFLALTSKAAQRVLLAVVILDIPLQFGTHLFYREEDAALGALGGLSISATTLALAGLYSSWLIRAFTNRNRAQRAVVNINWPLIAYFTITLLSVFVAQDINLSLFEVCLLLEACLVY